LGPAITLWHAAPPIGSLAAAGAALPQTKRKAGERGPACSVANPHRSTT